jgi:hypothetical protein
MNKDAIILLWQIQYQKIMPEEAKKGGARVMQQEDQIFQIKSIIFCIPMNIQRSFRC